MFYLISLALDFMRQPELSHERNDCIFAFLTAATLCCGAAFFTQPSAIDFILARVSVTSVSVLRRSLLRYAL
jgi:hypothetical protein